jgi:hypothetical protein
MKRNYDITRDPGWQGKGSERPDHRLLASYGCSFRVIVLSRNGRVTYKDDVSAGAAISFLQTIGRKLSYALLVTILIPISAIAIMVLLILIAINPNAWRPRSERGESLGPG